MNNFIANTFFDDGSQGIDDQFIKSAMARLTWQISRATRSAAYFDEIDKYRGHDMQSNDDPETAALQWFSPAYNTGSLKWTSTVTSRLLLEAGIRATSSTTRTATRRASRSRAVTADWFANASRLENDLGGRKTAATSQTTQSPERYNLQASVSYVTGAHNFKAGFQYTWGDFLHTRRRQRRSDAAVPQQQRPACRFSVPDSVVIRNTPLDYGERLNHDLGIFAQDSWRLNRLTVNAGIRWENVKAQVLASESPAGRFVPARSFDGDREPAELEGLGAALRRWSTTCSATARRRSSTR